ncbi:integral membrane protein [Streptomyces viridochromogenes DSM 40736]|uniref:Integral membrane protein n=1 Tax=Streptomyces viridochromogenes (strain DSM 40736 / JCM 4977 / BCRC 1201 / Tue 494) TaxID=591159 RepID=D9XC46_STRVT|nr:integral membrane protein [Streptomyces viridochromogenes DSM 40736]
MRDCVLPVKHLLTLSAMSSATPVPPPTPARRLPLAGVLRVGRPSEIWFKPALSVVAAIAPPNLTLLALGRLDLAMYTMAGSLCALYAHNRPYAARAGTLVRVVLGMLGGLAVALVAASLTGSAVVLVTVGALLAAAQKVLCDATRIGPPGNVVLTFVSSASLFAPQTLGQVPGHLALAAATGAWAWLVCMAPALVRPHGPERRATAHALKAAAAYADTGGAGEGHARARAAGYAAVHAAWQSLLATDARSRTRRGLERLVVRAEVALAAPAEADAGRLRAWAHSLRGTGPVPRGRSAPGGRRRTPRCGCGQVPLEAAGPLDPPRRAYRASAARSPATPSLALGIGRPYWALVTAASLYQANIALYLEPCRAARRGQRRRGARLRGRRAARAPGPDGPRAVLPRLQLRSGAADQPQLLARQCLRDPDGPAHHRVRRTAEAGRAGDGAGRGHCGRRRRRLRRRRGRHQPPRGRPGRTRPDHRRPGP